MRNSISLLERIVRKARRWSASPLVRRANWHRDRFEWLQAVPYYLESHKRLPWRTDLLIQAGNSYKEKGDFDAAIALYRKALVDPEQRNEALRQMKDIDDRAIAAFRVRGVQNRQVRVRSAQASTQALEPILKRSLTPDGSLLPPFIASQMASHLEDESRFLQLECPPAQPLDPFTNEPLTHVPGIYPVQLGNFNVSFGVRVQPLFAGVFSIRVRVVAYSAADQIALSFGEHTCLENKLSLVDQFPDGRLLYVANIWIDAKTIEAGSYEVKLSARLADGTTLRLDIRSSVVHLPEQFDLPDSDAFLPSFKGSTKIIEDEVTSLPAVVRNTASMMINGQIKSILVMRVDQLGDLSATLPAIRRLRDELPTVRLVALVAFELVDVVRASGIVDSTIGVLTNYENATGQRHISKEEAERLRLSLHSEVFDVAIDLCPGEDTRPLLLLVNAHERVGFLPRNFDFLDFGIDVISRDKANDHSTESHAALVLSLVESFLLKVRPLLAPVKRSVKESTALSDLALSPGHYVVVHCGARHSINRWPQDRFIQLATRVANHLDLSVLIFLEDDLTEGERKALAKNSRLIVLGKTQIDDFDELIANAYMMIGNDSGPKHLAAVRGVWVASVHVNRLNWNEWGQNGRGIIISKKVPCGACALNDERLCGQGVSCLRSITVDEVLDAVLENLPSRDLV